MDQFFKRFYVALCVVFVFEIQGSFSLLEGSVDLVDQRLKAIEGRLSAVENELSKCRSTVAFVAELTNNIENPPNGHHIVFDHPILNLGNGYNPTHGIFTAPVEGVYHFAIEITAPNQPTASHNMHIYIMKKDQPVAVTFLDGNYHQFLRRTGSILLELATGDDVWCRTYDMGGSNTIYGGNTYSMFSGFLIRAK